VLRRRAILHLVIPLSALVNVSCGESPAARSLLSPTPTQPTTNSPGPVRRTIALGEVVEVVLDAAVRTGVTYCDFGEDPAPCEWFVVDVPKAGALIIRMEFASAHPMFVELPIHELFIAQRSPLFARKAVGVGSISFTAGLAVPWGLRDGESVRFSLVASLETP